MAQAAASTSSTEDGLRRAQRARLGRVVGAHGLRGELRVQAEGGDASSLMQVPTVRLVRDDASHGAASSAGDAARDAARSAARNPARNAARSAEQGDPDSRGSREFEVTGARAGRSGECRLSLRGIDDRDTAEGWRGASVWVRATDLPELPEGEFYAFQLVGCRVTQRDGRPIGRVREIWETGANDVLVIEDEAGHDQLVPAVEPLLHRVDVAAGRIVVDAPPGLLDADVDASDAGRTGRRTQTEETGERE